MTQLKCSAQTCMYIDVDCEAVSCVHNENCKCAAREIGIGGAHACDCQDTECASFCCE